MSWQGYNPWQLTHPMETVNQYRLPTHLILVMKEVARPPSLEVTVTLSGMGLTPTQRPM